MAGGRDEALAPEAETENSQEANIKASTLGGLVEQGLCDEPVTGLGLEEPEPPSCVVLHDRP